MLKKFREFLQETMAHKIASLRAKTVARGATPGEAASALAKANELEKKYGSGEASTKENRLRDMVRGQGSGPEDIFSTKEAMRARWSKMAQDMRAAREANSAQWKEHWKARKEHRTT